MPSRGHRSDRRRPVSSALKPAVAPVEVLAPFLASPARPSGSLTYHQLQGFLFAVASSPEVVLPSEWLPLVFGEQDAGYADAEEAKRILGSIIELYNEVNDAVMAGERVLPADCVFRDDLVANFDPDAPVAQWARGFALGAGWLEDVWNAYLPEQLEEHFGMMLMTLSFFASREIAEAFHSEVRGRTMSFEALAAMLRNSFLEVAADYARMGRIIAQVMSEDAAREPLEPRRSSQVPRNAPCPCGSGKKYKRCCGA